MKPETPPRWCDFTCAHASFPDAELLGACRTMGGVWCKILGKVVPKHAPCKADVPSEDPGRPKP